MCKQKIKQEEVLVLTIEEKKYVFGPEKDGLRQLLTGKKRQKYLRRNSAAQKICLNGFSGVQNILETAVSLKISIDNLLIVVHRKTDVSLFLKTEEGGYSLCRSVQARSYASYYRDRLIVADFGCFKAILYRDKDNRLIQINDDFLSVDVCENGDVLATSTSYRSTLYFYDESKKELITLGYC